MANEEKNNGIFSFQEFLETIEVGGLKRLTKTRTTTSRFPHLASSEKRNYPGYTLEDYLEVCKIPALLHLENSKGIGLNLFSPIFRAMPIIVGETLEELKDRISESTKNLSRYLVEEHSCEVNAFDLSSLSHEECFSITYGVVDDIGIVGKMRNNFKKMKYYFLTSFYYIE